MAFELFYGDLNSGRIGVFRRFNTKAILIQLALFWSIYDHIFSSFHFAVYRKLLIYSRINAQLRPKLWKTFRLFHFFCWRKSRALSKMNKGNCIQTFNKNSLKRRLIKELSIAHTIKVEIEFHRFFFRRI